MRRRSGALAVYALCACAFVDATADTTKYDVDLEKSVFAFITMKAGALSGLVENVISTPSGYELELSVGNDVTLSYFVVRIDAASIDAQRPEILERWSGAIVATGILDAAPAPMSSHRRNRARKSIMSEDALDPERFPVITARMTSIQPVTGAAAYSHRIRFDLTIRDTTVSVDWPASVKRSDGRIEVETFGALHFDDFGMKPYSSLFGAIRYKNEFHVLVHIEAQRSGDG